MIKYITTDELREMSDVEGLVLQGCGGDPQEWVDGINQTLTEEGILLYGAIFSDISVFEHAGLTNILFNMDDMTLDPGKLAMWRLQTHDTFGGTWLSDYLVNRLGVSEDEHIPGIGEPKAEATIRVYIENSRDESIGGFTIPLPTTREDLQPWLTGAEITCDKMLAIKSVSLSVAGSDDILSSYPLAGISLDELNYLAVKLLALDNGGREIFLAAVAAEIFGGSIADMINIAENVDRIEVQPAFSEAQYGEFLIDTARDESVELVEHLEKSSDYASNLFVRHVLLLEQLVDRTAYGRAVAEQEDGVFTEYGYVVDHGSFREVYSGPEDIPDKYRVSPGPESPLIVKSVDLPSFLMKLYAVTNTPIKNLRQDLETLSASRGAEYLLLTNLNGSFLTEAADVYRSGSPAFETWMDAYTALAFSIHVTNTQGQLAGDIVQLNFPAHRLEVLGDQILPVGGGDARHFASEDLQAVHHKLGEIRDRYKETAKPISDAVFLINLNTSYMDQAENPQVDMLRISREAAKELVARGDGEVFRLMPEGPQRLSPLDVVKSNGLLFLDHREFAIKCEDLTGLDKWADRGAADAMRSIQHDKRKTHEPEL